MIQRAIRKVCDVCKKQSSWVHTQDEEPKVIQEFNEWRTFNLSENYMNRPEPLDFCSKKCLKKHIDDIYTD